MCGIAGIFHRRGGRPSEAALDAMTDSLAHRGPDGRGTVIHEGVGLGHRRLSIIGVKDGAQPMSDGGQIWVSYNGEIYNHKALRAELEAEGCVFRTGADTEVLVHGYRRWGEALPRRLEGIFAFVIHDREQGRLLCARDPLGVKPLYLHLTPELFLFGSEPKAILAHPEAPHRPDLPALSLYARYGYVPAPYCAFEGLSQLEPGCCLRVEADAEARWRYWLPPAAGSGLHSDAGGAFEAELDRAVGAQLMSEVPLGAFLSGGIDSSSVVASMCAQADLQEAPRSFTIGFSEAQYDESEHARRVAEALGSPLTVERVSMEALDLLDKLIDIYDEPFADSSAIPTYSLCEMTRRHVTVALSGDGGDELFGGYRRYQKLDSYGSLPPNLRGLSGGLAALLPSTLPGQGRLERLGLELAAQYDREISVFSEPQLKASFSPALSEAEREWSVAELYARAPSGGAVQRAQWADLMSYLPGDILTKVDRASMACSLEVRVPLLDHRFVEWGLGLPSARGFAGGRMKLALKEHLARRLPKEIIDRPKMGFGVPLTRWLKSAGGLAGLDQKLRARHPKGAYFSPIRPGAIQALTAAHGHVDHSQRAWSLLFLERWWQKNFS